MNPVTLTPNELKSYSASRALGAAFVQRTAGRNARSILETDVSDEIRKTFPNLPLPGDGIIVPFQAFARALNAVNFVQGSAFVSDLRTGPEPFPFPQSIIWRAGARRIDGRGGDAMGNVGIPTVDASSEAEFLDENSAASPGDFASALHNATPRRLQAVGYVTNQLLRQMENSDAFMLRFMADKIAPGIDRGALAGKGGVEPLGLLTMPGATDVSLGADGGVPSLNALNSVEGGVIGANFDIETAAYAVSTNARTKLKGTPKLLPTDGASTAHSSWLLQTDRGIDYVNGHRSFATSFMPDNFTSGSGSNLGSLVFGDFSKCYVVLWGGVSVVINPFSYAAQGLVQYSMTLFLDVVCSRPAAFARIKNIVTS